MDDSKHDSDEDRIIRALIKKQRKLADSLDPLERAGTLRVAVELDQRLSRCTDQEIANIMTVAQKWLPLFEREFVVCEHARRRLLRSEEMSLWPKELLSK